MSDPTIMSHQSRSNGSLPVAVAVAQLVQSGAVADDAIATRAYEKFVARGGAHGRDAEDWAAAKMELIAEALGPER
jgi:Protein of unknown function (DUF2934)